MGFQTHIVGPAVPAVPRLQTDMAVQSQQEGAKTRKKPAVRCRIKFIRPSLFTPDRIQAAQKNAVLLDRRHARRDVEVALAPADKQPEAPLLRAQNPQGCGPDPVSIRTPCRRFQTNRRRDRQGYRDNERVRLRRGARRLFSARLYHGVHRPFLQFDHSGQMVRSLLRTGRRGSASLRQPHPHHRKHLVAGHSRKHQPERIPDPAGRSRRSHQEIAGDRHAGRRASQGTERRLHGQAVRLPRHQQTDPRHLRSRRRHRRPAGGDARGFHRGRNGQRRGQADDPALLFHLEEQGGAAPRLGQDTAVQPEESGRPAARISGQGRKP